MNPRNPAPASPRRGLLRLLPALVVLALLALGGRVHAQEPTADQSLRGLSLVYLDTRAGPDVQLWVAAFDGRDARPVGTFPPSTRVLDLHGPFAALASADRLLLVDLRDGEQRAIEGGDRIRSALFGADGTLFYTTGFGCRSDPADFPRPSELVRVDPSSGEFTVLQRSATRVLQLIQELPETGELAVLPRGCDVGIGELVMVDAASGETTRTVEVQGCGWVHVSLDGAHAITGWAACTRPEAHRDAIATVWDLATGEGHDIFGGTDLTVNSELLFTPNGGQLVAGGFYGGVVGPRGSTSGAVWLFELDGRDFRPIWQGAREAAPLAWSPDGRYLLVRAVLAQGVCSHLVLDMATGAAMPIDESVNQCGVNGEVVGWAVLG